MPKREQFFEDMQADHRQVALLMAQVGAMPTELQLFLQVAEWVEDGDKGGLRPVRGYVVRVLGAEEHHINTLGLTAGTAELTTDHPLLYAHMYPPCALFFRGTPNDPNALALDLIQAHASTFQGWRHFPDFLDLQQSLFSLLTSGGGLVGQMPQNLAVALERVFNAHGLETKLMVGEKAQHSSPLKDQKMSALIIGKSYFLSYAFSFEEVASRKS
jgi:hypothetical protein